ncbi:MAG: poly(A) polymerase [Desulfobulbaceae bacterium]|nr:poly(A) polymerase [Desulfobulbaceae bacterium]
MSTHQRNNNEISPGVPGSLEPVIIPEEKHSIRIKDIDKEALKILYRLRDAGYSGYLVGGGVRDLYMGKRPKDFDISTDARPGQLRKLFRNSRTIGRRFRLVQVFFRGGTIIEVSTLRSQSEFDINGVEQVLPTNNTFGKPVEDAFRRDLTINSLFYEIEHNTIIDHVGGVQDLDQGIIRIIGDPDKRVQRDPVRMMRAIRHAARNSFTIEQNTWNSIIKNREKLDLCPPSRIRDELLKDLSSGASEPWARLALKSGLFFVLFPFYREVLSADGGGDSERNLLSLLRVVDRLYQSASEENRIELPDYFLLAVFLMPWAEEYFNAMKKSLKGSAHYRMSRKIRSDLNEVLGERYNFKRMAKEAMTSLFVNFATLDQFSSKKSWPKWLRNKSYFPDCYRFYRLVAEAKGGTQADDNLFRIGRSTDRNESVFHGRQDYKKSSSGGRKGTRPAFTDQKKGVFGLRGR